MSDIEIRLCTAWDDCVQCEKLQHIVWDMPLIGHDAVPATLLITAVKNGGLLVGAFEGEKMVGFAFGFLGSEGEGEARRLKHTSHMLGVLPDVRAKGLGAALKWRQREEALKQGLDLMTWTFDPLQAVNAQLNLARLGAIARRYIVNAYGAMPDRLNAGMDSDRFEVEWNLNSAGDKKSDSKSNQIESLHDVRQVYQVKWDNAGFLSIVAESELKGERLLLEIPSNINELKSYELKHAAYWRERTRSTFQRAFAAGYVATDVVQSQEGSKTRVFYLLEENFSSFA
jgi:predicted GNAT superfamily acetyltransferase